MYIPETIKTLFYSSQSSRSVSINQPIEMIPRTNRQYTCMKSQQTIDPDRDTVIWINANKENDAPMAQTLGRSLASDHRSRSPNFSSTSGVPRWVRQGPEGPEYRVPVLLGQIKRSSNGKHLNPVTGEHFLAKEKLILSPAGHWEDSCELSAKQLFGQTAKFKNLDVEQNSHVFTIIEKRATGKSLFSRCNFHDVHHVVNSFDHSIWSNCSFSGVFIQSSQTSFVKAKILDCRFEQSNFSGLSFERAQFTDCVFKNVDFSRSNFTDASFAGCEFIDCKMIDTNMDNSKLRRCKLDGIDMNGCKLNYTFFCESRLIQTDLEKTIGIATLQKVHLSAKEAQWIVEEDPTCRVIRAGELTTDVFIGLKLLNGRARDEENSARGERITTPSAVDKYVDYLA